MNWFLADNQGTVRDVVQYSGGATTVVDHLVYDSFGQIASQTQPANQPRFTYAGMRLDPVTGLYYDNARWYDPANGVFISQDPLGFAAGDPNTGRYCFNSPTNLIDPTGLWPEWLGDLVQAGINSTNATPMAPRRHRVSFGVRVRAAKTDSTYVTARQHASGHYVHPVGIINGSASGGGVPVAGGTGNNQKTGWITDWTPPSTADAVIGAGWGALNTAMILLPAANSVAETIGAAGWGEAQAIAAVAPSAMSVLDSSGGRWILRGCR